MMVERKSPLYSEMDKIFSPYTSRVGEHVKRGFSAIQAGSPVLLGSEMMAKDPSKPLIVMDGEQAVGVVTKTDLVRRVLARSMPMDTPIEEVMSNTIITIDKEKMLFDGLLLMIRHKVRHLLVTDEGRPLGVVSEWDWLVYQEAHLASSVWQIEEAESFTELAELKERANTMVRTLFDEKTTAGSLTGQVTEINDRISWRIIDLVLEELDSPPPVLFSWISFGSEGRREQALSTDQDNGIVFADVPEERLEETRAWFLVFAEKVVSGLEICGFPRCRGNTMASNPKLCLAISEWKEVIDDLVSYVNPDNLLKASIYFDFRNLYGEKSLVDALWEVTLAVVAEKEQFLKTLACSERFFGSVPVNDSDWRMREFFGMVPPTTNLKEKGLTPLVRCIRVLALKAGTTETNTLERLEIIRNEGLLPQDLAGDVRHAYEILIMQRMRQHLRQYSEGEPLHFRIDFKQLKRLDGRILVDALKTVRELEKYVSKHHGK